jgi:hypothetical protein
MQNLQSRITFLHVSCPSSKSLRPFIYKGPKDAGSKLQGYSFNENDKQLQHSYQHQQLDYSSPSWLSHFTEKKCRICCRNSCDKRFGKRDFSLTPNLPVLVVTFQCTTQTHLGHFTAQTGRGEFSQPFERLS